MAQAKYLSIKHYLLELILSGTISPGQRIPSEHWLLAHFSASRPTVRRAVDELAMDGLLQRKKGSGTFVSTSPENLESRESAPFHRKSRSSEVLLQRRVKRPLPIDQLLNLPPNRELFLVTTLHMLEGLPVAHEQRFAVGENAQNPAQTVDASERTRPPVAAMSLAYIEKTASAISVEGYLAKFLDVEDRQPCICVEWSTRLGDERFALLRTIYARPLKELFVGHSDDCAEFGVLATTGTR